MVKHSSEVILAMAAIEAYVRDRRVIDVPDDTPAWLLEGDAGAFVCLKIDGQLRGCIGTIQPIRESLAEEIIANAISAAVRDPRFMPVEQDELARLEYSVDVLSEPEEVSDLDDLDPKRYGVIVECGSRRGLLLPDLEGVDTAEMQVEIARKKASIGCNDAVKLYRFEVTRHH